MSNLVTQGGQNKNTWSETRGSTGQYLLKIYINEHHFLALECKTIQIQIQMNFFSIMNKEKDQFMPYSPSPTL